MNNMRNKILSLLVLLLTAATGAWAADGIACTTEDVGKLICTDGSIYATKAEANTAGKTAVAVIAYIDTENNKGLALALSDASGSMEQWCTQYTVKCMGSQYSDLTAAKTDMDGLANTDALVGHTSHTHAAASLARNYNVTRPDGASAWFLPSAGQWQKMIDAAGGFATLKTNAGMQSAPYWTSTERDGADAFVYEFYGGSFGSGYKDDNVRYVRSAFEFDIADPNAVEVTTNAASEGATFTEASFQMPAFDATVEYEALRDMSVQMPVVVGDGQDGYRLRIQKNAQGVYEPADMEFEDMLALFTVTDEIEQKSLTFFGQTVDCNLSVYAVDENDQPTGDAITDFTTLVPGRYVVMATAATGSDYDGQTAPSNIFELYQGYEVTVPAGEFVTYYKDENIYEEDDDAEIYTIEKVEDNVVTLSNVRTLVPKNTAMLVYNKSSEAKTFLLIPTDQEPVAFMSYMYFVGTLEPATIAASTDTQTNYACNGKAFVYVKDAISAGANKAWLEVPATGNDARQLKIVFADATGISAVSGLPADNGDWFDLNGRKIAKPTKKGVYIKDGKKVVIK